MSHVLYISVENVPPTTPGTALLGISLTVLPDSSPLNGALARPWLWQNLAWTVWSSPDGTTWSAVDPSKVSLVRVPSVDGPATTVAWKKALERSISAITNWPTEPLSLTTSITLKDDGTTPGAHQYLSLLSNVASGPYPIPQNLNLSFFVQLSGIQGSATQFLAAPSFTADGGAIQPTAGLPTPAVASMWDVTAPGGALKMLSWFSEPTKEFPSLWVPPPKRTGMTLVADWTAHLHQLIGTYLDVGHLLFNTDKARLRSLLPDGSTDWPGFRQWFIAGLYDLITSGLPSTANPNPAPSMESWCSRLKNELGDSFAQFPALTPGNSAARSFDVEMDELQKTISAATGGKKPAELMRALYGTKINDVPQELLKAENSDSLLQWFQVGLALPFAAQIAQACADNPGNFDAISAALCKTVISPHVVRIPSLLAGITIPSPVQTITGEYVNATQKSLVKLLRVRATGDDGTSWPVTTSAPPMVIPVMQLRSSDLKEDPLHGIRGVGVLIRRRGDTPTSWKCPNIVAGETDTSRPFLVASRLGYNQKLLTGFLLYDNGPIPCQNLLHNYLQESDRLQPGASGGIEPVFKYAPYEVSDGTDMSLFGTPMLESGQSYEVICFAVSNAGAVPAELRNGYPAKIKMPSQTKKYPSSLVQVISYYRTVPVGAMETRDSKGAPVVDSSGIFPRIPANVAPRSIETVVPRGGVGLRSPDSTPAKPSTLLVVPGESDNRKRAQGTVQTFVFSLKLPSIEPLTWDRTAGYQKEPTLRAQILDAAYSNLSNKKAAEITDPLITRVDLVLYRWDGDSKSGMWTALPGTVTFALDALRKSPTGVNSVETFPIQVFVDAGRGKNDGSVKLAIIKDAAKGVALGPSQALGPALAEGEIYLLEATFGFDGRVSTIMQSYPSAGTSFQLLIEIASAKMPSPDDLSVPFSINALPLNGVPDQQVVVALKNDSAPVWRNVHNADFLRQSWAWTGRTQPESLDPGANLKDSFENNLMPGYYPATAPAQSDPAQAWAMVEFAERPWTDHIVLPTIVKDKTFRWEQDMSLDPRASYLRFAPRVYSRYQGAFDGLAPQGVTTVGNGGSDLWKPCFLRSRVRKLEMPRLKALIPFTESAFAPGTPGILAVFDGPAYEQAGLAERLQVKIAEVKDPEPSTPRNWPQRGPDFLMSADKADPDLEMKLAALGPIGHTLDSVYSSFPKLISHSWIIQPLAPVVEEKPGPDFSWWFANLEFKLSVDKPSSVFQSAEITSQKTIGSWIQFLPGFQDSKHHAYHFDGWTLEQLDGTIKIFNDSGDLVMPGRNNERHTRHYLLVTRAVVDVTGKSREQYVGIAKGSEGTWSLFPEIAQTINKNFRLRCRFLDVKAGEINSSDNPPGSDAEFWQRIIGPNNKVTKDRDRASMTSLSPVIRQKAGSQ